MNVSCEGHAYTELRCSYGAAPLTYVVLSLPLVSLVLLVSLVTLSTIFDCNLVLVPTTNRGDREALPPSTDRQVLLQRCSLTPVTHGYALYFTEQP